MWAEWPQFSFFKKKGALFRNTLIIYLVNQFRTLDDIDG
jgi:hypothetical protein